LWRKKEIERYGQRDRETERERRRERKKERKKERERERERKNKKSFGDNKNLEIISCIKESGQSQLTF
jgi:hypothetical protein